MIKNISRTKLLLSLISLVITFFVWQQGLRDSLTRPSVSFDISQKEKEIAELSIQSVPESSQKYIIPNDPLKDINTALANEPFNELTERNKLILILTSDWSKSKFDREFNNNFKNENYKLIANNIKKKFKDEKYKIDPNKFEFSKEDKFLYHLLSKKFDFDENSLITNSLSTRMFLKLLSIRLMPLITIFIGSILALKTLWQTVSLREIGWKEFKPLDLDLIDMVLLISGGFVVLGEVVSPIFSISLVELFSQNISIEISQSLKIFFGYLFMALPPLLIVFYQVKSINGIFVFKTDYFHIKNLAIKDALTQGLRGWLIIIPFVLLVSLIMNNVIDNQSGSNPLLEIVLNNHNYLSFIILFLTTTILAPLFEEIIFRGILLPILSRDFGIIAGISISAFIFALAHLSISEMPPLLVLGIGLGVTRMISGSLLSSIFMHSLWNGLTFLNLFLLRT